MDSSGPLDTLLQDPVGVIVRPNPGGVLPSKELSMTGMTCPHQGTALVPGCENKYPTILTVGAPGEGQVRNPEAVL